MEELKQLWGKDSFDNEIYLFELRNNKKESVFLSNLGARIVGIQTMDQFGNIDEITLGYNHWNYYLTACDYFGATIGRTANRTKNGMLQIGEKEYQLTRNQDGHHLHGGNLRFSRKIWSTGKQTSNSIEFLLESKDKEEGYPGNLKVKVTYSWDNTSALTIKYEYFADQDTVVNLTNHAYFNLNGEGKGKIHNHLLQVASNEILESNKDLIVTGKIIPIKNTPFDFSEPKEIGESINDDDQYLNNGNGYDHFWLFNKDRNYTKKILTLTSQKTGRILDVYTDYQGVQIYSCNYMDSIVPGRTGKRYLHRNAVCIEPSYCPNNFKNPNYETALIKAGKKKSHFISLHFSTRQTPSDNA
ncbi:MAG: aldose epimerase family protein [Bacteroidales bacterium]